VSRRGGGNYRIPSPSYILPLSQREGGGEREKKFPIPPLNLPLRHKSEGEKKGASSLSDISRRGRKKGCPPLTRVGGG